MKFHGAELAHPANINTVFAILPAAFIEALESDGIKLRSWPNEHGNLDRLVTSYEEPEDQVKRFESVCSRVASAPIGLHDEN